MDDDELIANVASGDDTALRQLFDRHAPWLAARLRNALPSDDVADVLQETFLAVWKNAGSYQPRGTPSAWLWVIARNQAALLHRRRSRPGPQRHRHHRHRLARLAGYRRPAGLDPPMAYAAFAEYALLEAWRSPWTWPVRPPDDRGAWICAVVVFAAGLAAFTVRGARSRLTDTG